MKGIIIEVFNNRMKKTPGGTGALTGGISISGKTKLMDERLLQWFSLNQNSHHLFFLLQRYSIKNPGKFAPSGKLLLLQKTYPIETE